MSAANQHPSEDTWERLATGELDEAARTEAMRHVVSCPRCARAWRALRHVAREARAFDPAVPAAAPHDDTGPRARVDRRRDRIRRALLLGGTIALAAAVVLFIVLPRRGDDADKTGGGGGLRGGGDARVELVEPPGAAPWKLTWRAFPGAERYVVEVFSGDGRRVWKGETSSATEIVVEPAPAPGTYRWQVEAWSAGRRLSASAPGRLVVGP